MLEETMKAFAFDLVDETLTHVFDRLPQDVKTRVTVYRFVASQLLDIADDLSREYLPEVWPSTNVNPDYS